MQKYYCYIQSMEFSMKTRRSVRIQDHSLYFQRFQLFMIRLQREALTKKADADCMHFTAHPLSDFGKRFFNSFRTHSALLNQIRNDRIVYHWNNKSIFQQCKMARIPLSFFHYFNRIEMHTNSFYDDSFFFSFIVHVYSAIKTQPTD